MDNGNIDSLKLPQTVVGRLIKDTLPAGVNVSKEVKVAIARAAAIFVLHATNYANENAQSHKRKNITAADVLSAVRTLDCEELEKPVVDALQLFKAQKSQRLEQRKRRQTTDDGASTLSAQSTPSKQSKRAVEVRHSEEQQEESAEGEASELRHNDEEDDGRNESNVEDEMDSQRPFL